MKPYSIILDIDGTLATSNKTISIKTKETLIKLQEMGHTVILASGRPTTAMMDYARELEMDKHHGILISFNGACAVDVQSETILYEKTISVEDAKAVLNHLEQFDVMPMIAYDDVMYVNDVFNNIIHTGIDSTINIIQYESRSGKYRLSESHHLADVVERPLYKILIAGQPDYLSTNYKAIHEPFEGKLNSMFTAAFYYEFTDLGIDKAKALDFVLEKRGLDPKATIAFGDGHNDESIVRYASTGVAMANAVDALKDIADIITLSNDEDGIAHTLNQLFDLS